MKPGRHICTVCSHIYEESDHPRECGCDASFDRLPDEWKCPECGNDKDKYQPCSCVTVSSDLSTCQVHRNV